MLKILAPLSAAGLAASVLALAGPIAVHAAGTTGPCSGAGTGNPVQHTGNGHHSFTDSHNNCVNFAGTNDTAYLEDSDFNLINMNGNNDLVHNFKNSNNNTITFPAGANFDTLGAKNANGNTVAFTSGSVNDVVTLLATTNDNITINGSGLFATVEDPSTGPGSTGGNTCTVNSTTAAGGTSNNPAIVIC